MWVQVGLSLFLTLSSLTLYAQPSSSTSVESDQVPSLPNPLKWSAQRLKECYLDLEEECTEALIQIGLNQMNQLSVADQIVLKTYEALTAFAYRDRNRVRNLLKELIALDPQVQLPPASPKSMTILLEELRPQPKYTLIELDLGSTVLPLEGKDTQQWSTGYGGRLGVSLNLPSSWRMGTLIKGAIHSAQSKYMDQLINTQLSIYAQYGWSTFLGFFEMGFGPHFLLLMPTGLFDTSSSLGFGVDLRTRLSWKLSTSLRLYVEGTRIIHLVSQNGIFDTSSYFEGTLGIQWALSRYQVK